MSKLGTLLQHNPNMARWGWLPPVYVPGVAYWVLATLGRIHRLKWLTGPCLLYAFVWPYVLRQQFLDVPGNQEKHYKTRREIQIEATLQGCHPHLIAMPLLINEAEGVHGCQVIKCTWFGWIYLGDDCQLYYRNVQDTTYIRLLPQNYKDFNGEDFAALINALIGVVRP